MRICADLSESLLPVVMKLCRSTVFQLSRFTNFAGEREREREREKRESKRERDAHESIFCFGLVS